MDLICTRGLTLDLVAIAPISTQCNILRGKACDYFSRDPLTVILAVWSFIQLVWVSMLLVTQLFLISRAQTTWESMRGRLHRLPRPAQALTNLATSGSTNPEDVASHQQRQGYFAQWSTLLGVDTFVATAAGRTRRQRNPFSRGIVINCQDFWCDGLPYFGRRQNGQASLDGVRVDYTKMYDAPVRLHQTGLESGPLYEPLTGEDA